MIPVSGWLLEADGADVADAAWWVCRARAGHSSVRKKELGYGPALGGRKKGKRWS
jgi:hypothetical protein